MFLLITEMGFAIFLKTMIFEKRSIQAGSLRIEMKKIEYDIIVARVTPTLPQNN